MNFVEFLMVFCVFGIFCRRQHGLSRGFYRDIFAAFFPASLSYGLHKSRKCLAIFTLKHVDE